MNDLQNMTPALDTAELLPPPAPEEELKASAAPEVEAYGEVVRDPQDFLSDLDVNLAACRTVHQLDEVWAEDLETICGLGMQLRQKAELIYERHRCRVIGQPVEVAKQHPRPRHESLSGQRPGGRAQFAHPEAEGKKALGGGKT